MSEPVWPDDWLEPPIPDVAELIPARERDRRRLIVTTNPEYPFLEAIAHFRPSRHQDLGVVQGIRCLRARDQARALLRHAKRPDRGGNTDRAVTSSKENAPGEM